MAELIISEGRYQVIEVVLRRKRLGHHDMDFIITLFILAIRKLQRRYKSVLVLFCLRSSLQASGTISKLDATCDHGKFA